MDGPAEQLTPSDDKVPETTDVAEISDATAVDSGSSIPLRSINAVAAHVSFIEDARTKVTSEMESMVFAGLANLVRLTLPSCCVGV